MSGLSGNGPRLSWKRDAGWRSTSGSIGANGSVGAIEVGVGERGGFKVGVIVASDGTKIHY